MESNSGQPDTKQFVEILDVRKDNIDEHSMKVLNNGNRGCQTSVMPAFGANGNLLNFVIEICFWCL